MPVCQTPSSASAGRSVQLPETEHGPAVSRAAHASATSGFSRSPTTSGGGAAPSPKVTVCSAWKPPRLYTSTESPAWIVSEVGKYDANPRSRPSGDGAPMKIEYSVGADGDRRACGSSLVHEIVAT